MVVPSRILVSLADGIKPAAPIILGSTTVIVGGKKYVARWELITPEIAEAYLSQGRKVQRGFRELMGKRYKKQMEHGRWYLTHQGIGFDDDIDEDHPNGHFSDGQHRLWAVKESGIAQVMLVVYGIPKEAFKVIDTGAARTPGDMLRIYGFPNANARSTAVGAFWRYHTGRMSGVNTASQAWRDEILYGACLFPHIVDDYSRFRHDAAIFNTTTACWMNEAFRLSDRPDLAESFVNRMFFGEGLSSADSGIKSVRHWIEEELRHGGTILKTDEVAYKVARLWNIEYEGKPQPSNVHGQNGNPYPDLGRRYAEAVGH